MYNCHRCNAKIIVKDCEHYNIVQDDDKFYIVEDIEENILYPLLCNGCKTSFKMINWTRETIRILINKTYIMVNSKN
jgi:hypothetical protein